MRWQADQRQPSLGHRVMSTAPGPGLGGQQSPTHWAPTAPGWGVDMARDPLRQDGRGLRGPSCLCAVHRSQEQAGGGPPSRRWPHLCADGLLEVSEVSLRAGVVDCQPEHLEDTSPCEQPRPRRTAERTAAQGLKAGVAPRCPGSSPHVAQQCLQVRGSATPEPAPEARLPRGLGFRWP